MNQNEEIEEILFFKKKEKQRIHLRKKDKNDDKLLNSSASSLSAPVSSAAASSIDISLEEEVEDEGINREKFSKLRLLHSLKKGKGISLDRLSQANLSEKEKEEEKDSSLSSLSSIFSSGLQDSSGGFQHEKIMRKYVEEKLGLK